MDTLWRSHTPNWRILLENTIKDEGWKVVKK